MIDDFLNRLDKVRKVGQNYTAVCPVGSHSGKNRTLSIKEVDGVVIGQCFSCGARVRDVADFLGLNISHINPHWQPKEGKREMPFYPKEKRKIDSYIVQMIDNVGYDTVSIMDKMKYKEAKQRLDHWNEHVQDYYNSK